MGMIRKFNLMGVPL
jgi:hypothetical protein